VSKLGLRRTICLVCFFCAATPTASPAQTFTTLHSFDGTDGEYPCAGLVQATNGNFYGTPLFGGASSNCPDTYGCGTVFEVAAAGKLTTLYNFCAQPNCTDGAYPVAGLVQASDGNFYGTTNGGGGNGVGTVFKITPGGTLTRLYSFCSRSACTDGANPGAGLIQAADGNFYGTTYYGGASESCYPGCGTVFKITPRGTLTTLHSFDGTDGANPSGGLIQATDANFYGTTYEGGAKGGGTVFKITAGGTLTTLYSFCVKTNCTDGSGPDGGLVQATNGNFYGTTFGGGANCAPSGCGTVFELTPEGTLTTLHSFDGADGSEASGALVQATNGNFYGTTEQGRVSDRCIGGCGTVFEITPAGTLTTLHSFDFADGESPSAGLLQATNGSLYGTAVEGGAHNDGTIFGFSVGLGPFVETRPTSGKVGTAVIVLGNSLTGSTSVSFNGTAAAFRVVSETEITTTVPKGATTGKVKVKTPHGTLTSNVNFRVM